MPAAPTAPTKVSEVRSYFDQPQRYISARGFDIQIRAETVQELTAGMRLDRVLDIGCGDGSISLPLLSPATKVTFLDLTPAMTELTRSKVPAELARNAEFLNDDFMSAKLTAGSYDLVICLGVLAHVDSPAAFIAKLASLLTPDGRLILEFTDSLTPMGRLLRGYQWVCSLRKPQRYPLNKLWFKKVHAMTASQRLRVESNFRYSLLSIAVLTRGFSRDSMYRAVRRCFGTATANRNGWLGEESICVLTKESSSRSNKVNGGARVSK